jgi:hypothetical protein
MHLFLNRVTLTERCTVLSGSQSPDLLRATLGALATSHKRSEQLKLEV